MPYTNLQVERFLDVISKWEYQTAHISSTTDIMDNIHAKKIIKVGAEGIPYIFQYYNYVFGLHKVRNPNYSPNWGTIRFLIWIIIEEHHLDTTVDRVFSQYTKGNV